MLPRSVSALGVTLLLGLAACGSDAGDGRTDASDPAPSTVPDSTIDPAAARFVGLTETEAQALAADEGIDIRVARIDDQQFGLTADFVPDRINVEIDDGVVTSAFTG